MYAGRNAKPLHTSLLAGADERDTLYIFILNSLSQVGQMRARMLYSYKAEEYERMSCESEVSSQKRESKDFLYHMSRTALRFVIKFLH